MRFTIVYASATGHTEDIAERLNTLLPDSELKDLDRIDFTKELEEAEASQLGSLFILPLDSE